MRYSKEAPRYLLWPLYSSMKGAGQWSPRNMESHANGDTLFNLLAREKKKIIIYPTSLLTRFGSSFQGICSWISFCSNCGKHTWLHRMIRIQDKYKGTL